jgi:pilus assembly protein Flp/PilA
LELLAANHGDAERDGFVVGHTLPRSTTFAISAFYKPYEVTVNLASTFMKLGSRINPAIVTLFKSQRADMKRLFAKFLADEAGATAIEYGLIAAGISIAIIVAVNGLGTNLNTVFTSVNTSLK